MYKARITRQTPAAIVVLMDQSGSMAEQINFHGTMVSKAQALSSIVDMMLAELLIRCKCEGSYRDYFDIAVVSYGGDGLKSKVSKKIAKPFVSASELSDNYIDRVDISRERLLPSGRSMVSVIEQKRWIEPEASGATPMLAALEFTLATLEKWVRSHNAEPHFPPLVFNITDGEASDASDEQLRDVAAKIKALDSGDGTALLFNIHISSIANDDNVLFPCELDQLPVHKYARLLYDMSSELPAIYNDYIESLSGSECRGAFRGVGFNTDMNKLLSVLNIGSASINLL